MELNSIEVLNMQQDIFEKLDEIERKFLKEWISIQLNQSEEDTERLEIQTSDFLADLPARLFQSKFFIKRLLEQKNKKIDGDNIVKYISKELLENDNFLESIISFYPKLIQSLPEAQKKNKRLWSIALAADGNVIKYLPEDLMHEDLIDIALEKTPRSIKYLPSNLIDEDRALNAIRKNAQAYKNIPEKFQDNFDFCKIACNRNLNVWDVLKKPIKFNKFILEFCLTKSGIEGIYHAKKLQDDESFLKLLFVTGNKQRQKMILAYMKDEVIESFASKILQENKEALKIFKLCSEVGKDNVFKKIESDLPKILP